MTDLLVRTLRRVRRPLLLTGIVALPFAWAPIAAFGEDHAFLINASPSLRQQGRALEVSEIVLPPRQGARP